MNNKAKFISGIIVFILSIFLLCFCTLNITQIGSSIAFVIYMMLSSCAVVSIVIIYTVLRKDKKCCGMKEKCIIFLLFLVLLLITFGLFQSFLIIKEKTFQYSTETIYQKHSSTAYKITYIPSLMSWVLVISVITFWLSVSVIVNGLIIKTQKSN